MTGAIEKVKSLFVPVKPDKDTPKSQLQAEAAAQADKDFPSRSKSVRRQEAHAEAEALADERIAEREVEESAEPPAEWTPPTIEHGREPLATVVHRASLKREGRKAEGMAETGPRAGSPDMEGVTHIPESELPARHERKEHTATRPSDPNDPNSMDGLPDPTSAGDDLAI